MAQVLALELGRLNIDLCNAPGLGLDLDFKRSKILELAQATTYVLSAAQEQRLKALQRQAGDLTGWQNLAIFSVFS